MGISRLPRDSPAAALVLPVHLGRDPKGQRTGRAHTERRSHLAALITVVFAVLHGPQDSPRSTSRGSKPLTFTPHCAVPLPSQIGAGSIGGPTPRTTKSPLPSHCLEHALPSVSCLSGKLSSSTCSGDELPTRPAPTPPLGEGGADILLPPHCLLQTTVHLPYKPAPPHSAPPASGHSRCPRVCCLSLSPVVPLASGSGLPLFIHSTPESSWVPLAVVSHQADAGLLAPHLPGVSAPLCGTCPLPGHTWDPIHAHSCSPSNHHPTSHAVTKVSSSPSSFLGDSLTPASPSLSLPSLDLLVLHSTLSLGQKSLSVLLVPLPGKSLLWIHSTVCPTQHLHHALQQIPQTFSTLQTPSPISAGDSPLNLSEKTDALRCRHLLRPAIPSTKPHSFTPPSLLLAKASASLSGQDPLRVLPNTPSINPSLSRTRSFTLSSGCLPSTIKDSKDSLVFKK